MMPDKTKTRPLLVARLARAEENSRDAVETLALAREEGFPQGRLHPFVDALARAKESEAVERTMLALADAEWERKS